MLKIAEPRCGGSVANPSVWVEVGRDHLLRPMRSFHLQVSNVRSLIISDMFFFLKKKGGGV